MGTIGRLIRIYDRKDKSYFREKISWPLPAGTKRGNVIINKLKNSPIVRFGRWCDNNTNNGDFYLLVGPLYSGPVECIMTVEGPLTDNNPGGRILIDYAGHIKGKKDFQEKISWKLPNGAVREKVELKLDPEDKNIHYERDIHFVDWVDADNPNDGDFYLSVTLPPMRPCTVECIVSAGF